MLIATLAWLFGGVVLWKWYRQKASREPDVELSSRAPHGPGVLQRNIPWSDVKDVPMPRSVACCPLPLPEATAKSSRRLFRRGATPLVGAGMPR